MRPRTKTIEFPSFYGKQGAFLNLAGLDKSWMSLLVEGLIVHHKSLNIHSEVSCGLGKRLIVGPLVQMHCEIEVLGLLTYDPNQGLRDMSD